MRLSTRLATGLALAAVAVAPSAANAASPYEKGPNPTVDSVRAAAGPYALNRVVYSDAATPGFGAAAVFWPKAAAGTTFGAVAFAPGFTESSSSVSWIAQRVASFGFVTIVFNANNTWTDQPDNRGRQLLAALDFVKGSSAAKSFVDPNRLGVSGHSMGGGATLYASQYRPSLKAAVGQEPWNSNANFGNVTVPSLEIGAQFDFIAPVALHAQPFYRAIPNSTPKTYAEFAGGDHFLSNSPSSKVGAATVSWFKRYIDEDTRYAPFICGSGGHTGLLNSELSSYASNC